MFKVGNTVVKIKDGENTRKRYEIVARHFVDWAMEDDGMFPIYTYQLADSKTGKKIPGLFKDSEINRINI